MENNLDNAKKYLVETNFEFFTQSEQNVIGKTMVAYFNFLKSQEEKKTNGLKLNQKKNYLQSLVLSLFLEIKIFLV